MSKHKLKQFLFGINSNKNDKNRERGEGKEYSVVVLLSGYPYAFYDKTQETYEGFAVDIMRKLFKDLKKEKILRFRNILVSFIDELPECGIKFSFAIEIAII